MLWFGDVIILLLTGALTGAALFQTWPDILPTNWETLLAGLLALIGAILTVRKMEEQIQTQRQINKAENDREAEKLRHYARGRFLMHTNLLFEYLENLEEYIITIYTRNESDAPPALPRPIRFDEIFDPNLILPDEETSQKVQDLLTILQVVQANLPTLHSDDVGGEPEVSLSYVFQAQWISIQILKDARTKVLHAGLDQSFRQYLLEKISSTIDSDLADSEKKPDYALCKTYLDACKNRSITQL